MSFNEITNDIASAYLAFTGKPPSSIDVKDYLLFRQTAIQEYKEGIRFIQPKNLKESNIISNHALTNTGSHSQAVDQILEKAVKTKPPESIVERDSDPMLSLLMSVAG